MHYKNALLKLQKQLEINRWHRVIKSYDV